MLLVCGGELAAMPGVVGGINMKYLVPGMKIR